MQECTKVKKLLSRYLDKETTGFDSAIVKAHLDTCHFCREEFLGLSRIKGAISGKERKALPEDLLVFRMREEITLEEERRARFSLADISRLSRRLIPVPVGVIILSVAFLILSPRQPSSKYSLEDSIINGRQITTEMVLGVILGTQS